jgi:hypothetical protein
LFVFKSQLLMSEIAGRTRWRTPFDPLVKSNLESFLVVCHCFVFYGSRFKVQWFTCTEPRFDVTRPAEAPACDGNGKAKAKHKGKGEE